jgi:hypothetical protein
LYSFSLPQPGERSSSTLRPDGPRTYDIYFLPSLIQQAQESAKLYYPAKRRGGVESSAREAQESAKLFYPAKRRGERVGRDLDASRTARCPFHVHPVLQDLGLGLVAFTPKPPPQNEHFEWLNRSLKKEKRAQEQVTKEHQERRTQEAISRKRQRDTVSEEGETGEEPGKRAKRDQTDTGKERKRGSSDKTESGRREERKHKGATEAQPHKQGSTQKLHGVQDGRTVCGVPV